MEHRTVADIIDEHPAPCSPPQSLSDKIVDLMVADLTDIPYSVVSCSFLYMQYSENCVIEWCNRPPVVRAPWSSRYCPKFNFSLKERIRDEFGRTCFLCPTTEEENGVKLSVHHVDYNKGQGCGHEWNLVPLCRKCHVKTNYNRWHWFNLLGNYWAIPYWEDYIASS